MRRLVKELLTRYPALVCCETPIESAISTIIDCFKNNRKLMLCGNGGSAADCEHIAGELLKGFVRQRPLPERWRELCKAAGGDDTFIDHLQGSLPVISLTSHIALSTAFANDIDSAFVFAQQLFGLGKNGDVLLAISTSGNAKNVCNAAIMARAKGIAVIGLSGENGGNLADLCDVLITVPENETYKVQEYHLPIYHTICLCVEEELFCE